MRKSEFAEWLLRRAAGEVRGVAIYGDLLEMAAGRGITWFWLTYLRTLLGLLSRPAAAFVAGTVAFVVIYRLRWMRFFPPGWRSCWSGGWVHHAYFVRSTQSVMFLLWFLLPFAAARYGLRDRFVRLTFAVCAMVMVAYFAPAFSLLLAGIGLALLFVSIAIFSNEWRGAGITLAGTTVVSFFVELALFNLAHIGSWYYARHRFGPHFELFGLNFALERHLFWTVMWTMFVLNVAVLVAISTRLRRRFMRGERATLA